MTGIAIPIGLFFMEEIIMGIITIFNSKKEIGLHITTNHSGKMSGMYSLSTNCCDNKYCKAYSQDSSKICSKCYAQTQMKCYKNMKKPLSNNYKLLTTEIIDKAKLPIINALYFRFESFGDIANDIQVINYFNICNKNRGVKFALWTKNPFIVQKVLDAGYKKPQNLQIVLSSHYINVVADKSRWSFVDKVFTVYSPDYIAEHNVDINCGAKSCLKCHKCYKRNEIEYVNEKLK